MPLLSAHDAEATSSEDGEAPESFSLLQSKRVVQEQDGRRETFHADQKRKKKDARRERDRKLKERTVHGKGTGETAEVFGGETETMMASEDEETDSKVEGTDDEFKGFGMDDMGDTSGNEEGGSGENGGGESASEEDGIGHTRRDLLSDTKLPDHLFASASSSKPLPTGSREPLNTDSKSRKKHTKRRKPAKDLIIGSRAVRTLSDATRPVSRCTASTIPARKVRKFIDRSLGFKAGNLKARGWERRAANIGVMKTSGAPAAFVRSR